MRFQVNRVNTPNQVRFGRTRIPLSTIALAVIFLLGLALLLYPLISSTWNEWRAAAILADYTEQVEQLSQDDTQDWLERARAYNESLVGKGIPDAFAIHSAEENSAYTGELAFRADGVMGSISIPRINVNLPIYHGTGTDVLTKGAGHLQGSALPVGGEGTHCVISAHRGLPSAAMFTDLDQLELGDHFYLSVLGQTIAYEVDKIEEVEPDETRSLAIEEGEDLCTLVTCTPYGVNTHRLLVRGHRVEYNEETKLAESTDTRASIFTKYWLWVVLGLAVVAAFTVWVWRRTRKREQDSANAQYAAHLQSGGQVDSRVHASEKAAVETSRGAQPQSGRCTRKGEEGDC